MKHPNAHRMTRDHQLRVLTSGLAGVARDVEMLRLLMLKPRAVRQRLSIRLRLFART